MGTSFLDKSDLYLLHNYVQNTGQAYAKKKIIEVLRNFFEQDSYYRYVRDQWGFPLVVDHTNLPFDAGLHDTTSTTRLFIGDVMREGVAHYPSILVRPGGYRSMPIAFSRNKYTIQWGNIKYVDGYGNETIVKRPLYYQQGGAWEGSINVEIKSLSSRGLDELVDLCMIFFEDYIKEDLVNAGIWIKDVSNGSPSETDDLNKKLFTQNITLDIRTEWLRQIPINSTVDVINICVEIGNLEADPPTFATNLQINSTLELAENLLSL